MDHTRFELWILMVFRRSNRKKWGGIEQCLERWTVDLTVRVRSSIGVELYSVLTPRPDGVKWAGLSVCNCRHTDKWCGTIKAVGNTDHTRQTWIHTQTPLSPLAGCGPVGEGMSGKVLNWVVRSLNNLHHHRQQEPDDVNLGQMNKYRTNIETWRKKNT